MSGACELSSWVWHGGSCTEQDRLGPYGMWGAPRWGRGADVSQPSPRLPCTLGWLLLWQIPEGARLVPVRGSFHPGQGPKREGREIQVSPRAAG